MGIFSAEKFDGGKTDWETPQLLFDYLNDEFQFTLDAAASEQNKKCSKYYSIENSGLLYNWYGETIWCNPPYGREVPDWLLRGYEAATYGNSVSVFLILAKTNTKWWHELVMKAAEIRFIKGRPKFKGAIHGLPFPLCLVIYRPNIVETKITSLDYSKLPTKGANGSVGKNISLF